MKHFSSFFLIASAISASAFTLDFSGLDASLNGSPAFDGSAFADDKDTFFFGIPGFGNIGFSTDGNPAFLGTNFGAPALEFDSAQIVSLQFISGNAVANVVPTFIGAPQGVTPVYTVTSETTGTLTIPSGSAGLASITFDEVNKIPEPSVSILGALGALALLRRRR